MKNPASSAPALPHRLLRRCCVGVIVVHLCFGAIQSANTLGALRASAGWVTDNSFPESRMWHASMRLALGEPIYLPVGGDRHDPVPYGPLFFWIPARVGAALGGDWRDFQLAGRGLSLGALFLLLGLGVGRGIVLRRPAWAIAAAAMVVLGQQSILDFAAGFRPDLPGVFLELLGLGVFVAAAGRGRVRTGAVGCGMFAACAFLMKPTLVGALPGFCLALLLRPPAPFGCMGAATSGGRKKWNERLTAPLLVFAAYAITAVVGIFLLVPPPRALVLDNLLASRHCPFSAEVFRMAFSLNATHLAFPAALLAWVLLQRGCVDAGANRIGGNESEGELSATQQVACIPVAFWVGGAFISSLLLQSAALFKIGANAIYWTEPLLLGGWLLLEAFPGTRRADQTDQADQADQGNRGSGYRHLPLVGMVLLALALLPAAKAAWYDALRLSHRWRHPITLETQWSEWRDLERALATLPRPLLSDDPRINVHGAGVEHPLVYDTYFAAILERAGVSTLEPVTRRLEAGEVGAVLLTFDAQAPPFDAPGRVPSWPPVWTRALHERYAPSGRFGVYSLWLPQTASRRE